MADEVGHSYCLVLQVVVLQNVIFSIILDDTRMHALRERMKGQVAVDHGVAYVQ